MPKKVNRGKALKEAEVSKNFQAAKEMLKNKGYLFDTVMGAVGDPISIQDLDMGIVYQNEMMKKVMGAHEGELCYAIYEKRDKICEGCPIVESYKDGKIHQALRVGILPDGTPNRFENIAAVLKNERGEIVAGIEVCRDVEKRERALESLKQKTEELEKFRRLATGRELKMIELKKEIEKLKKEFEEYKGREQK